MINYRRNESCFSCVRDRWGWWWNRMDQSFDRLSCLLICLFLPCDTHLRFSFASIFAYVSRFRSFHSVSKENTKQTKPWVQPLSLNIQHNLWISGRNGESSSLSPSFPFDLYFLPQASSSIHSRCDNTHPIVRREQQWKHIQIFSNQISLLQRSDPSVARQCHRTLSWGCPKWNSGKFKGCGECLSTEHHRTVGLNCSKLWRNGKYFRFSLQVEGKRKVANFRRKWVHYQVTFLDEHRVGAVEEDTLLNNRNSRRNQELGEAVQFLMAVVVPEAEVFYNSRMFHF